MSLREPFFFCTGQPRFPASAGANERSATTAEATAQAWQHLLSQADPRAALAQVGGRFSVAWRRPDGKTVLATDRFGIEPLCYRVVGAELRFASRADEVAGGIDLTALAATTHAGSAQPGDEPADLDPQALFDYLYFHVIPSPRTIFRGVFRLPPGHLAVFERGDLRIEPYWVPTFQATAAPRFDDLKAEFHQLLEQAVSRQLEGADAACFLSGGTDSSTVAGMIGRVAGRPADTYSIGFEAEGYDEMAFARIAAKQFGCRHHEYYVTPRDLVDGIAKVASHYDQPFGNSSALPSYYCARMAHGDGVRKLLAGDGGDELFGGNTRYAKQRVFSWYDNVPSPLRSGLLEPVLGSPIGRLPLLKKGASYIDQARVPMPDRLQSYNLLTRLGLVDVLEQDFLRRVDPLGPQKQQRQVWSAIRADTLVDRMLAFDWRYTLADTDLPKVVGTTQLAGTRVGFPMLDDDLLAFSERLPADYKLRGLKLRWFFKEALRGFLPDEIITKKKQGFGLPFGVWATRDEALRSLATDSLGSLATRGIVRADFIQSLLRDRLKEHPGYYGEMVWILMMLEQWLRSRRPNYRI
ncbi:asparagine synthetase B family protein [Roseateles amylovorans]|uniref:asparagine synthase (glutamine-hydrolyzing) n=1 Tax=Roseateles amylovorans TaxID=2978473 RepID=A0ABY6B6L7_9BURK|nr:asparagine synthase C-terminal domain-containing protein [Roseateles amylovorans]UXH80145.1 asparagine synthase C-terminal domain-containing protein [Roseateles amylovorans]